MNKELVLSFISKYLNDNKEMVEDDFDNLFRALNDKEKDKVYKILSDEGIELVEDIDDTEPNSRNTTDEDEEYEPVDLKNVKLTNEQLCVMYQRGDKSALTLIAIKNEGLLSQRAWKYSNLYNHKLDFDDLKQYGFIGMKKAVERFDLSKETKFSTYAVWWIDQSIKRSIADDGFTIRIPVHMFDKINIMINLQRQYSLENHEKLIEVMKDKTEYSTEQIEHLIFLYNYIVKPSSLDLNVGEDGDTPLIDLIEEDEKDPTAEIVNSKILKEALKFALDTLTERENKIMRLRFGLDDGVSRTLEEVGKEFNVTRERIRQIEAKALRKLRHPKRSRKLKDFFID